MGNGSHPHPKAIFRAERTKHGRKPKTIWRCESVWYWWESNDWGIFIPNNPCVFVCVIQSTHLPPSPWPKSRSNSKLEKRFSQNSLGKKGEKTQSINSSEGRTKKNNTHKEKRESRRDPKNQIHKDWKNEKKREGSPHLASFKSGPICCVLSRKEVGRI